MLSPRIIFNAYRGGHTHSLQCHSRGDGSIFIILVISAVFSLSARRGTECTGDISVLGMGVRLALSYFAFLNTAKAHLIFERPRTGFIHLPANSSRPPPIIVMPTQSNIVIRLTAFKFAGLFKMRSAGRNRITSCHHASSHANALITYVRPLRRVMLTFDTARAARNIDVSYFDINTLGYNISCAHCELAAMLLARSICLILATYHVRLFDFAVKARRPCLSFLARRVRRQ